MKGKETRKTVHYNECSGTNLILYIGILSVIKGFVSLRNVAVLVGRAKLRLRRSVLLPTKPPCYAG